MLSSAVLAVSALAVSVSADLGKNILFPQGLHDPLSGLDNLYQVPGSYSGVDVPQDCKDNAANIGGCNVDTIQAVSVKYDDCADPWIICRCDNANMDLNTILARFAQVPVGLRSYVGHVLATYTENTNAYNAGGFIALNGDTAVSVYLHEASHSLDQGVSTGDTFKGAIAADSCVPDGYADTSEVEDFAQVSVMYTYQKLVGQLPADASCMQNQLNVFVNDARLNDDLTATQCDPSKRPKKVTSSAKFAASKTSSAPKGENTPSVNEQFHAKHGSSRDAPASKNIKPVPHVVPHYREYKEDKSS